MLRVACSYLLRREYHTFTRNVGTNNSMKAKIYYIYHTREHKGWMTRRRDATERDATRRDATRGETDRGETAGVLSNASLASVRLATERTDASSSSRRFSNRLGNAAPPFVRANRHRIADRRRSRRVPTRCRRRRDGRRTVRPRRSAAEIFRAFGFATSDGGAAARRVRERERAAATTTDGGRSVACGGGVL